MKLIDVLEFECCQGCDDCPYNPDGCVSFLDEPLKDALWYLKDYRESLIKRTMVPRHLKEME